MKLRLQVTVATLTLAAWPAFGQPAAPAPSALETLGAMRPTGSTARLAGSPARRRESRTGQEKSGQDQAAARLPDLALCTGSRCPAYRSRAPGRRDVRRHPQVEGLGRDRPRARRRRRRGEGVRPDLAEEDSQRGCFSKDGFLYIVEQNRVLEYPAARILL